METTETASGNEAQVKNRRELAISFYGITCLALMNISYALTNRQNPLIIAAIATGVFSMHQALKEYRNA